MFLLSVPPATPLQLFEVRLITKWEPFRIAAAGLFTGQISFLLIIIPHTVIYGHYRRQPGLAGEPLILTLQSSLSWSSSQNRQKLSYPHGTSDWTPLTFINCHPNGFWRFLPAGWSVWRLYPVSASTEWVLNDEWRMNIKQSKLEWKCYSYNFCSAMHCTLCLAMAGFSMAEYTQIKPTESIFAVITCNKTNHTICVESELKNRDISRQGFKSCLKSQLFERAYS